MVVSDPDVLDLALADAPVGTEVRLDAGAGRVARLGSASIDAGLVVDRLPPLLRVLAATPTLVAGIVTVVGAFVLRRVLAEVAAGRPFAARNPRRIGMLAGLALIAALLPGVIASGATVAVLDHLDVAGPDAPFGFTILEVSAGPLVVAAVLGVVAHVFRYGQRLVDDVAGLV